MPIGAKFSSSKKALQKMQGFFMNKQKLLAKKIFLY